jgi:hypothetical protein
MASLFLDSQARQTDHFVLFLSDPHRGAALLRQLGYERQYSAHLDTPRVITADGGTIVSSYASGIRAQARRQCVKVKIERSRATSGLRRELPCCATLTIFCDVEPWPSWHPSTYDDTESLQ